ncbi:MAG: glycosyltransferase family 2 protein [Syntrophales bacterium]|nr:glycosyltransferase family 2 protein [Syntrophales bacterium]
MDISFIVVNWNTRDLLRLCLASIYSTVEGIEYEVFVVDNGSSDGSVEMVKREFPLVRLIENKQNKGFAAANNQALCLMKGRYAFLLNSDACLTKGAVKELFQFMERHKEAAMCCGQLLNEDGTKQRSFASFPNLLTLLTNESLLEFFFPKKFPGKRRNYTHPIEVDSCIGAAMLVRKKAIDEVGKLDERYFFFFEETDWAYAMRKAGWKIYFLPSALVYHFQGQSIGERLTPRLEYYRSRYRYFEKWYPPFYYLVIRLVIIGRLIVNWLGTGIYCLLTLCLLPGARQKFLLYSRLVAWHLKGDRGRKN